MRDRILSSCTLDLVRSQIQAFQNEDGLKDSSYLCKFLTRQHILFLLCRFDIYRKVPKDLTQPTYTGAIISICCCLFILFLFLSELTGFITTEVVNELYVDDPDKDSGGKIDVSLNLSLPNLHCELVGLDIQDEMGRHEVGHIDNSMKIPLNNGAGCRFEGQFSINKSQGLQIPSQAMSAIYLGGCRTLERASTS
uniref:Endoplasmic reticulum-Golgi intermediate compartment protein n=1 Tax=Castor canadensis TaxID=51338 RepID=A0A8B7W6H8_CASCN|nr:endoplasmic reticulum-Golgi intermediate compartment protein 1-like [Castor canadensis]